MQPDDPLFEKSLDEQLGLPPDKPRAQPKGKPADELEEAPAEDGHNDRWTDEPPDPELTRVQMRGWLIAATSIQILAALCSAIPAMMSIMVLNRPPTPGIVVMLAACLSFPLVCLVAAAAGWVFYAGGWYRMALLANLAPLVNVAAAVVGALTGFPN